VKKWLNRSYCFAEYGIDHYDELKNVPDNPHSLFEGVLGFSFFLQILQNSELYKIAQTLPF